MLGNTKHHTEEHTAIVMHMLLYMYVMVKHWSLSTERQGGRVGGGEGGRERRREGGREGGRERGREEGREEGKEGGGVSCNLGKRKLIDLQWI